MRANFVLPAAFALISLGNTLEAKENNFVPLNTGSQRLSYFIDLNSIKKRNFGKFRNIHIEVLVRGIYDKDLNSKFSSVDTMFVISCRENLFAQEANWFTERESSKLRSVYNPKPWVLTNIPEGTMIAVVKEYACKAP